MARRLIPLLVVGCLAAAGLWLIHLGIEARVAALPDLGVSAEPAGPMTASEVVDWRTPQADRQLSPALASAGASSFHAGLGAAVTAWSLALFWLLWISRAGRSSRLVSALWLAPAAWGLASLALEAGPWAPSANMAMESFWIHAPVFGLFLCLGLSFRSGAGRV